MYNSIIVLYKIDIIDVFRSIYLSKYANKYTTIHNKYYKTNKMIAYYSSENEVIVDQGVKLLQET